MPKTNIIIYLVDITLLIVHVFFGTRFAVCKYMTSLQFIETNQLKSNVSIFKIKKYTNILQNQSKNVSIDTCLNSVLDFFNNINP